MGILRVDKISGLEKERTQNPNLVANGDFSEASIAGWTAYNAVVSYDSGAGGRIKVDDSAGAGGWSNAAYVVNTEPGASYRFEVRASATDSDTQFVGYYQGTYDTAGTAPTVYSSEITTTPSVHYFDLIATGSTVTIMLIANNNGVVYYDDISFRKTDGNSIGGSVHFRGNARDDNLNMSADYGDLDFQNTDFTFESWVYPTDMSVDRYWCSKGNGNLPGTAMDVRFDSDGQIRINFYVSTTAYSLHTSSGVLQENVWSHVAVVRSGTSFKSYVNGRETSSATHNITVSDVSATFNVGILQGVGTGFQGYMSNFRFVRGKAVYTEEFTPSVYVLEPIDGTVLLCCNNSDSAGAVSLASNGTSKTIVVNGNTLPSTFSPGLTRDFTNGTEFRGVTTFDTQGYFVPPSGTTEQRGRGRGIFSIGSGTPGSTGSKNIEYVQISSSGNGIDFGDLSEGSQSQGAVSSTTRSVISLGDPVPAVQTNILEFITIATTGDAVDFGDMTTKRSRVSGVASQTRGVYIGGTNELVSPYGGSTISYTNTIDYITIASLGDAINFGDTITKAAHGNAVCNSTRGLIAVNYTGGPRYAVEDIQYLTISTTGNTQDFGDLTRAETYLYRGCSGSNSTRGIFGGGYNGGIKNIIDYVTITTTGNAIDFGDLTLATRNGGTTSNSIRTMFFGGYNAPNGGRQNIISYVNIMSTGNAQEFGDCKERGHEGSGSSDSHGGLS
jgi:hypothetical protein